MENQTNPASSAQFGTAPAWSVGAEHSTAKSMFASHGPHSKGPITVGAEQVRNKRQACTQVVCQGQEGTCAQDLQQLVNHVLQFVACSSSAPEVPAAAPSSDSQQASEHNNGCLQVKNCDVCTSQRKGCDNRCKKCVDRSILHQNKGSRCLWRTPGSSL